MAAIFSRSHRVKPCSLPESLQNLTLHLQVGRDIAACCCHRCMTEIIANHRDIHTRLQSATAQLWRITCGVTWRFRSAERAVPRIGRTCPIDRRRRHALAAHLEVFLKQKSSAVPCSDDPPQSQCCFRPERTDSSFWPFPSNRTCLGLSSRRSQARTANASLTRAPVL